MNTEMYILLVIIIVLIVLILGLGVYFLIKTKRKQEGATDQSGNQVNNDVLKEKIDQTTKLLDNLSKTNNESDKKFIEDLTTLKGSLSNLWQMIDKDNKEVKQNLTLTDDKIR